MENQSNTELEAQNLLQMETNSKLDSIDKGIEAQIVGLENARDVLKDIERLLEILATKEDKEIPDQSKLLESIRDSLNTLCNKEPEKININLIIE